MYTVLEYFTDLQDNRHVYKSGDEYPRQGYKPTDERIAELSGNKNVRKHPIIKANEAVAEVTEEKPKKRGRKKASEE